MTLCRSLGRLHPLLAHVSLFFSPGVIPHILIPESWSRPKLFPGLTRFGTLFTFDSQVLFHFPKYIAPRKSNTAVNMQIFRFLPLAITAARAVRALSLNISVTAAANNASTIECWQMDTPFASSATPGVSGSATALIGNAANITFTVVPAGFDGGLHRAPFNQ